jgi:hypothetical protein
MSGASRVLDRFSDPSGIGTFFSEQNGPITDLVWPSYNTRQQLA